MKTRRSRRTVTPRRVIRRHRCSLEQLEDRTLLTSGSGDDIGDAILLNTPSDVRTGSVAPGSPVFFKIKASADALLVARVQSAGGYTRLSLLDSLDSLGRLLVQSDGQSASNPDDLIEQHIPAGTDYLEVQSRGGAGTFVLSSDLAPASEPYQPINEGLFNPNVFGDFNGDGLADLAGAAGVQLNLGDGTFGPTIPLPVNSFSVDGGITDGYFDGTGRLDLAAAIAGGQSYVIEALLNNGEGSFRSAPTSLTLDPAFNDLNGIITGNFEGLGLRDLVVSLGQYPSGITSLAVIQGDGDGGFSAPVIYSLGVLSPTGDNLVAADFSGRGLDDIAVAGTDATGRNVIDILVNDGNGRFSPAAPIDLGDAEVDDLVAGDFSGDGRDDLAAVLTNTVGSSVEVFQSRGDGTFQAEQPVGLGDLSPFSSAVDDFTLDHRADIAVAGVDSADVGIVDVLLNQGNGSFSVEPPIDLGNDTPFYLGAGNYAGDGRPDLVVSGFNGTNTLVTVLPGNGDGTFRAAQIAVLSPINDGSFLSTSGLSVEGDFNGDGRPDLAVLGSSSVQVLLGAGDGTFRALPPIDVGGFAPGAVSSGEFFVSGDFTGDGHLDLAIGGQDLTLSENKLVVLLGKGDGTFAAPILVNLGDFAPFDAVVGDFTGDGLDDLLIEGTNPSFQTVFELFKGDRNGTFGAPTPINLAGLAPSQFPEIATGDFTGIGHDELAVVGSNFPAFPGTGSTPELAALVLQINQDGTTTDLASADLGAFALSGIAVGDFRSRGRSSLAVVTQDVSTSEQYLVELSFNGDGTSSVSTPIDIATNSPTGFAVADFTDFNGDGLDDLAIGAADQSGNGNILVAEGSNDGTFQVEPPISLGTLVPFGLVAGDFTGDGRTDLILNLGSGAQNIDLLRGNGDGTFGNSQAVEPVPINNGSVQSAGGPFVAGDFNNDGRLSVAVGGEDPSTSEGQVDVLLGNGDGSFDAEAPTTLGFRPTALVTGDFTGDGLLDVAAAGVDSLGRANVEVFLGDGQGTTRATAPIVLGDFAADPLTTGSFTPVDLLSGDFTGDGRLDLAVVGTDD